MAGIHRVYGYKKRHPGYRIPFFAFMEVLLNRIIDEPLKYAI